MGNYRLTTVQNSAIKGNERHFLNNRINNLNIKT